MSKSEVITKREGEIIGYVAKGYTNKEIAERMGLSVKTVETHRANLRKKLRVRNASQLLLYSIRSDKMKPIASEILVSHSGRVETSSHRAC